MSQFTTSSFGDQVAYDHITSDGPTVIFVAGAGPWRAIDSTTSETAALLSAAGVGSIVYDRVGRGESFIDGPISLDREVAAIVALRGLVEGPALLCGHSSGCVISLYAATHGVPVDGLALWEAPFGPPDSGADTWSEELNRLLDTGTLEEAFRHFMKDIPPEFLDGVIDTPHMVEQAGSLKPDGEALAWIDSAPLAQLVGEIAVPVVALVGEETFEFMTATAVSIAGSIPGASWSAVPGANHTWQPEPFAQELGQLADRIADPGTPES